MRSSGTEVGGRMNDELLDEFVAGIDLYVETGLLVELDEFLKSGWRYRNEERFVVVEGPDDRTWLPGVSRLIHVLSYTRGSLHRQRPDNTIELVAWRSSDGRGFRVVFERGKQASDPI